MKKMDKVRSGSARVLALGGALLFLITSLGFSFFVIWQIHQQDQQSKATADVQKALQQAQQNQSQAQNLGKLGNFKPVAKVDQLQTTDTKPGTGQAVKSGDTVTVNYTGAVASTGAVFDSSAAHGQAATFALDQVIPGWQQGMVGMKVGGTRRMLIPATLGYGANPPQGSNIPANADLVFDVELVKIGQ